MMQPVLARFRIGQSVRHADGDFHGVIIDVDGRYEGPSAGVGTVRTDQPFYQVLVTDDRAGIIAYVAEESLRTGPEVEDSALAELSQWFRRDTDGLRRARFVSLH